MKIKYKNFTIEASCEEFDPELYHKVALWVSSPSMYFDLRVFPGECSKAIVEDLLSGDEEKAGIAIHCLIMNREYEISQLKRIPLK